MYRGIGHIPDIADGIIAVLCNLVIVLVEQVHGPVVLQQARCCGKFKALRQDPYRSFEAVEQTMRFPVHDDVR